MGKVRFNHILSVRTKFKDERTIELVVMDSTTTETFGFIIPFRSMKVEKVSDDEKPVQESHESEELDSVDSEDLELSEDDPHD